MHLFAFAAGSELRDIDRLVDRQRRVGACALAVLADRFLTVAVAEPVNMRRVLDLRLIDRKQTDDVSRLAAGVVGHRVVQFDGKRSARNDIYARIAPTFELFNPLLDLPVSEDQIRIGRRRTCLRVCGRLVGIEMLKVLRVIADCAEVAGRIFAVRQLDTVCLIPQRDTGRLLGVSSPPCIDADNTLDFRFRGVIIVRIVAGTRRTAFHVIPLDMGGHRRICRVRDRRAEVELVAVRAGLGIIAEIPAHQRIARAGCAFDRRRTDQFAVVRAEGRRLIGLRTAAETGVARIEVQDHAEALLRPLCVDGNIVVRHIAAEIKRIRACGVFIPTAEFIAGQTVVRNIRFIREFIAVAAFRGCDIYHVRIIRKVFVIPYMKLIHSLFVRIEI